MNKQVTNKHIPLWWLLAISAFTCPLYQVTTINARNCANKDQVCTNNITTDYQSHDLCAARYQALSDNEAQQILAELMNKANTQILDIKKAFDDFFNTFNLSYTHCLDRMKKTLKVLKDEVKQPLYEISKTKNPATAEAAYQTVAQICDLVGEIVKVVEEYRPTKNSGQNAIIAAALLGASLKSGKDKLKNAVLQHAIPRLNDIGQKATHDALSKEVSNIVANLQALVSLDKGEQGIKKTLEKLQRRLQG